jgi:SET domain-containing protein
MIYSKLMTEAIKIIPIKNELTGKYRFPGLRHWTVDHGGEKMLGVVATEPMKKGSRFEYFGKKLDKEQFDALQKEEKKKRTPNRLSAIVQVTKNLYLDAYHSTPLFPGQFGKYLGGCVNEPEKGFKPNCKLVVSPQKGGHAFIEAIRDILIGEELTMNYGNSYKRVGYSKS